MGEGVKNMQDPPPGGCPLTGEPRRGTVVVGVHDMATTRSIDFGWTTVFASTTSPTKATLPISDWMSAVEFAKIRATLELRGKMGNIEVQFGCQTVDSTASPDAAVGVGAFITADGLGNPSAWADLSAITPGKQFIRFVFLTRDASGTTTNLARISAVVDYYGF